MRSASRGSRQSARLLYCGAGGRSRVGSRSRIVARATPPGRGSPLRCGAAAAGAWGWERSDIATLCGSAGGLEARFGVRGAAGRLVAAGLSERLRVPSGRGGEVSTLTRQIRAFWRANPLRLLGSWA